MLHRKWCCTGSAADGTDGEATLEEQNTTINADGIFEGAKNFERNVHVWFNQSRQVSLGSEEATEVNTQIQQQCPVPTDVLLPSDNKPVDGL